MLGNSGFRVCGCGWVVDCGGTTTTLASRPRHFGEAYTAWTVFLDGDGVVGGRVVDPWLWRILSASLDLSSSSFGIFLAFRRASIRSREQNEA